MGDVSQNINYETGMNDWEALKEILFDQGGDRFRILAKSYRNTIRDFGVCRKGVGEGVGGRIQDTAGDPPWKAGGAHLRAGGPAVFESGGVDPWDNGAGPSDHGGDLPHQEEAEAVKNGLAPLVEIRENDGDGFQNGIMVLPIQLTKGLEFDAVILWKPDGGNYGTIRGTRSYCMSP